MMEKWAYQEVGRLPLFIALRTIYPIHIMNLNGDTSQVFEHNTKEGRSLLFAWRSLMRMYHEY